MLASLKQNHYRLTLEEGPLVQTIIEKTCTFSFPYIVMMRKKVVVGFSTLPPMEELVVLVDHPQTLPNQSTGKPLAVLLVTAEQFHQLLF